MPDDDIRPPIPMSCVGRPVVGGLVAPFVNIRLADGGVDFRAPHQATWDKCWTQSLCQTCGRRIAGLAVLFGGPNQLRSRHFDEPPTCGPCAVYVTRACPMVSGRQERYATRHKVSEGPRGKVCATPGCECGGFTPTDPTLPDIGGDPAHPWYALYLRPGSLQLTAKSIVTRCSDRGCEHERQILSGALLRAEPVKVVLVSAPGEGRIWRTLEAAEVAALMPEPEPVS